MLHIATQTGKVVSFFIFFSCAGPVSSLAFLRLRLVAASAILTAYVGKILCRVSVQFWVMLVQYCTGMHMFIMSTLCKLVGMQRGQRVEG